MKEKIIFMGTPEFSVPVLKMLIDKYNVVLVVCQPDKEVGRKKVLTYPPTKEIAIKNNIEVFQPLKIRNEYQKIIDYKPDIIITCAYGQIIPKEILDYPMYGCINVHASLLPKLRGGAPIHHAIIDGYRETGITIMYMDELMDNGDIIYQEKTIIDNNDTYNSLHDRLSIIGRDALDKTLPSIFSKTNLRMKQNSEAVTFGYNIKREEELINFNLPVKDVYNHIRGLNKTPGAYALLDNENIKIFDVEIGVNTTALPGTITSIDAKGISVACLDKTIIIKSLQVPGKNKMNVKDYLNGIKKENLINKRYN